MEFLDLFKKVIYKVKRYTENMQCCFNVNIIGHKLSDTNFNTISYLLYWLIVEITNHTYVQ